MSDEKEVKGQKTEKSKKDNVPTLEVVTEDVQEVIPEKAQDVFVEKSDDLKSHTNEVGDKKKSLIVKGYSRVDRSFRKNNK